MTQADTDLMIRARLYHGDGLIDLAFGLLAWIVGAKRVVGYIGLLAIMVLSGFWLPTIVPTLLIVLGASIMLVGAVLLARFIHDHPLQVGSASSGR